MSRTSTRLALSLGFAAALVCSAPAFAQNVLTAVKVAQAPKLDALAADPAWAKAPALAMKLNGGKNFADGSTEATLKAVYTSDTLYVLLQYKDPTQPVRRFPYQKQPDGSWKKLVDPADKCGDDNIYYEDKYALIWNINKSIKNFDSQGCFALCHMGETKPYGNKYTASEGEIGEHLAHEVDPHRLHRSGR